MPYFVSDPTKVVGRTTRCRLRQRQCAPSAPLRRRGGSPCRISDTSGVRRNDGSSEVHRPWWRACTRAPRSAVVITNHISRVTSSAESTTHPAPSHDAREHLPQNQDACEHLLKGYGAQEHLLHGLGAREYLLRGPGRRKQLLQGHGQREHPLLGQGVRVHSHTAASRATVSLTATPHAATSSKCGRGAHIRLAVAHTHSAQQPLARSRRMTTSRRPWPRREPPACSWPPRPAPSQTRCTGPTSRTAVAAR